MTQLFTIIRQALTDGMRFNLFLILSMIELVDCVTTSPLNGIVLKLVLMEQIGLIEFKKINGTISEISGVLAQLIDWLSLKYNFSYIFLPTIAKHGEDSPAGKGATSYIISGEADLVLGGTASTSNRIKKIDFSTPWLETPIGFLIPYPTSNENIAAIVKPFDLTIWLLLLASFPVMMTTLYTLGRVVIKMKKSSKIANDEIDQDTGFDTIRAAVDYVTNVFFSHGGWCSSKKLAIRLAAGAWCLASFVIITAYSSVLTSFIVSPNLKPIIESIRDIPKVPGLQVVAIKGSSIERVWPIAPNGTSFRMVADQWRADPSLLFITREQCAEQVRNGNRVYPDVLFMLASIMNKDQKETGKCSFTIAKQLLTNSGMSLYLAKNSPYTDSVSKGILEMQQLGLIQHWGKQFIPQPGECRNNYQNVPEKPRISLKNLSGAFLILVVGLTLAFLAFIMEKIIYYHKQNFNN